MHVRRRRPGTVKSRELCERSPEATKIPDKRKALSGTAAAQEFEQAPEPDGPAGYIHSVETGAAADGPGMRFVFFLAGCSFRCLYCHNPDTWTFGGSRPVSVRAAVAEAARYAGFLRMAGGVTLSGGDPLAQAEFAGELLRRLHDGLGLHTALDTQGFLHRKVEDRWFDALDLVLLDIKHIDPVRHRDVTGRPLQPTLDFARRLVRLGKPMWIRYVLVPGLTDDAEDIARLADTAAGLGPLVERVELLPFHQLGSHKWAGLNRPYRLAATPVPSASQIAAAAAIIRSRGLTVS
jgi:pyruvate formate lyase activating enzyme